MPCAAQDLAQTHGLSRFASVALRAARSGDNRTARYERQHLVERVVVEDETGMEEAPPDLGEFLPSEIEDPADGQVGVEAEAILVAHREEEDSIADPRSTLPG